jgi:hypothetical protein
MGIAGMHIAFQRQHPIYHYGQDYLGVLEAYIAAPFFRLFGVSDITLRLGMLIRNLGYRLCSLAGYRTVAGGQRMLETLEATTRSGPDFYPGRT